MGSGCFTEEHTVRDKKWELKWEPDERVRDIEKEPSAQQPELQHSGGDATQPDRVAAHRPPKLSATFVRTINRKGRYGDGRGGYGLMLMVKPTKNGRISKSWVQRLRIHEKVVDMGLGPFPLVSLKEAKDKAFENQRAAKRGEDPRVPKAPTFEEAAEIVIAMHAEGWKDSGRSEKVWRSSLANYAYEKIGHKRIDKITRADVMDVLRPIWLDKAETAQRLHNRLSAIMRWAIAQDYRQDNPAGDHIIEALPKQRRQVQHMKAIPHKEVAAALAAVRAWRAWDATKLAFEFLVLTAGRSGEVRRARWSEIDLKAAVWTIPAERMKAGKEHRVPLSKQALGVLDKARSLSDGTGLVFPSKRGKELSDGTMSGMMKDLGIKAVPHGFRSSFRDWCADTGVAREVAEAALAHVVGGVEGAYARTDLLDRRRPVMDDWADYVT